MKSKKRCYFCDSPYQVFTCIHIELIEKNRADIYVIDTFSNCQDICARLRNTGLFEKVIVIQEKRLNARNSKYKHLLQIKNIVLSYCNLDSIVEKYIEKDIRYDEMFFSCHMLYMRLARLYFLKKGYHTEFIMYDEGRGSYTGQFERRSRINLILEGVVTHGASNRVRYKKYLYQPRLDYRYEDDKEMIYQLYPIGNVDRSYKKIYEYIYNSPVHDMSNIKCIFFDGIREENFFTKDALDKMQSWYQIIEDIIGPESMILKTHPRAKNTYPHECMELPNSSCPAEVNYFNMDLDTIVFITLASTAVINPKILFDKEPIVIILGEMDEEIYRMTYGEKIFFQKVKEIYRDREKFYMPHSMQELKQTLNSCKAKMRIEA